MAEAALKEDVRSENNGRVRAEQIDGTIYMMASSPHYRHSEVADNIHYALRSQLGTGKCRAFMDCIDFVYHPDVLDDLKKKDYVVPDDVIICDQDKIKHGSYYGKPKFIAEISSPSTAELDRTTKMAIYEEAEVSEYWIVDPNGALEIYYLDGAHYKLEHKFMFCNDKDAEKDYNAEKTITLRDFPVSMMLKDVFE